MRKEADTRVKRMDWKELKKAAKKDYCAMVKLGVAYYRGEEGLRADLSKGVKILSKAASSKYCKSAKVDTDDPQIRKSFCLANDYLGYYWAVDRTPSFAPTKSECKKAMYYYDAAARLNDGFALFSLAKAYREGLSKYVKPDPQLAEEYFEKASAAGYCDSLFRDAYELERRTEESRSEENSQTALAIVKGGATLALNRYRQAAFKGSKEAKLALALKYMKGDGVKCDYGEAKKLIDECAAAQMPAAIYYQGYVLAKGLGCERDPWKAFAKFREADEACSSQETRIALGCCYAEGFGCIKKIGKAAEYFRDAIEEYDSAAGYYYLGRCMKENADAVKDSLPKKERKDAEWYIEKAAQAGYAPALYELAHFNDPSVEEGKRKGEKAFDYYTRAYERGSMDAAVGLAKMYRDGLGVARDLEKCQNLLKEAERAGNAEAMLLIAQEYAARDLSDTERFVDEDQEYAGKYYRYAADAGSLAAARTMYEACLVGDFQMQRDPQAAFGWKEKMAVLGDASQYYEVAVGYEKGVVRVKSARRDQSSDRKKKAQRKSHPTEVKLSVEPNGERAAYWYAMASLYAPDQDEKETAANRLARFSCDKKGVWGFAKEVEKRNRLIEKKQKTADKIDRKIKKQNQKSTQSESLAQAPAEESVDE